MYSSLLLFSHKKGKQKSNYKENYKGREGKAYQTNNITKEVQRFKGSKGSNIQKGTIQIIIHIMHFIHD